MYLLPPSSTYNTNLLHDAAPALFPKKHLLAYVKIMAEGIKWHQLKLIQFTRYTSHLDEFGWFRTLEDCNSFASRYLQPCGTPHVYDKQFRVINELICFPNIPFVRGWDGTARQLHFWFGPEDATIWFAAQKPGSFRNSLGIFVPLKFSNIDIVEQMGYIYIYFYM